MSEKEGQKAINGEDTKKIPSIHLQRRKLSAAQRTVMFITLYWRSLTVFLVPILLLPLIVFYDSPVRIWAGNSPDEFLMLVFRQIKEFRCMYVVLMMTFYWVTEALPLPITSMIPLVLFPALGVLVSVDKLH